MQLLRIGNLCAFDFGAELIFLRTAQAPLAELYNFIFFAHKARCLISDVFLADRRTFSSVPRQFRAVPRGSEKIGIRRLWNYELRTHFQSRIISFYDLQGGGPN